MGKTSFKKSALSEYGHIAEKMHGLSYGRTIMPARPGSKGEGITLIFRNRQGGEKPFPYEEIKKMTKTVKAALRKSGRLKKRDKQAKECDDPLLCTLLIAQENADRLRHTSRRPALRHLRAA